MNLPFGLRDLSPDEAARRARRITWVLTDCDGVLTDAGVYCSAAGEELLRFSRRDGMGVQRLRESGITAAIVTRERSPIVTKRADKLGIDVYAGVGDKRAWLATWLIENGVHADELAYIGDDVNDVPIASVIRGRGLVAAPADAEAAMTGVAHFISARVGGAGAFREFAEWILGLRAQTGLGTDEETAQGNRGGEQPWA